MWGQWCREGATTGGFTVYVYLVFFRRVLKRGGGRENAIRDRCAGSIPRVRLGTVKTRNRSQRPWCVFREES